MAAGTALISRVHPFQIGDVTPSTNVPSVCAYGAGCRGELVRLYAVKHDLDASHPPTSETTDGWLHTPDISPIAAAPPILGGLRLSLSCFSSACHKFK
ncbi:hypothetical protein TCA2_5918 [Paenibacillus sp. TCA20]|nr:hypothetical protein TCA2_5918 [Paenibacillus sp. TCA20]